MSKFRLEINIQGFNEVRRQQEVRDYLRSYAERIAANAGGEPDYIVVDATGPTRARYVVVTATAKAMRDEAVHRTLSKAFAQ
jgi:dsRNA-specific ribonuclease